MNVMKKAKLGLLVAATALTAACTKNDYHDVAEQTKPSIPATVTVPIAADQVFVNYNNTTGIENIQYTKEANGVRTTHKADANGETQITMYLKNGLTISDLANVSTGEIALKAKMMDSLVIMTQQLNKDKLKEVITANSAKASVLMDNVTNTTKLTSDQAVAKVGELSKAVGSLKYGVAF